MYTNDQPKEKHFKNLDAFTKRDYLQLKYPHLYYLKETDSIVLMEQFRTISTSRIESPFKNSNNQKVVLSKLEQTKLTKAFLKIIKNVIE